MFSTLVVSRKRYPRAFPLDWKRSGLEYTKILLELTCDVTLIDLMMFLTPWQMPSAAVRLHCSVTAIENCSFLGWASYKATTSRLTVMDSRSLWCITTGVWSDTKRVKTLAFRSMKRLLLKCEHDVFTTEYWMIWRIGDPFWFLWQYQIELVRLQTKEKRIN